MPTSVPSFTGGLAFIDPLTPIVALGDPDTKTITFRRYDGTGSPNTAANWTAPKAVGLGEDPDLAGGASGVYLSYRTGAGQLIRRYEQSGDRSAPNSRSAARAAGRRSTATFTRARAAACTRPGPGRVRRRCSTADRSTVASWLPTETLAVDREQADFYGQHVATSGDGGGLRGLERHARRLGSARLRSSRTARSQDPSRSPARFRSGSRSRSRGRAAWSGGLDLPAPGMSA